MNATIRECAVLLVFPMLMPPSIAWGLQQSGGQADVLAQLRQEADARFNQQDYHAAMDKCSEALAIDPDDMNLRWINAMSSFFMGQADIAIAEFDLILGQHPDFSGAYFYRGLSRAWLGVDISRAIKDLARAEELTTLETDPAFTVWIAVLGGESPKLESLAADDGWYGDVARYLLGHMTAQMLLEEATSAADETTRRERLCEVHCYLGVQYELDGNMEKAEYHYKASRATGVTGFVEYYFAQRGITFESKRNRTAADLVKPADSDLSDYDRLQFDVEATYTKARDLTIGGDETLFLPDDKIGDVNLAEVLYMSSNRVLMDFFSKWEGSIYNEVPGLFTMLRVLEVKNNKGLAFIAFARGDAESSAKYRLRTIALADGALDEIAAWSGLDGTAASDFQDQLALATDQFHENLLEAHVFLSLHYISVGSAAEARRHLNNALLHAKDQESKTLIRELLEKTN